MGTGEQLGWSPISAVLPVCQHSAVVARAAAEVSSCGRPAQGSTADQEHHSTGTQLPYTATSMVYLHLLLTLYLSDLQDEKNPTNTDNSVFEGAATLEDK